MTKMELSWGKCGNYSKICLLVSSLRGLEVLKRPRLKIRTRKHMRKEIKTGDKMYL